MSKKVPGKGKLFSYGPHGSIICQIIWNDLFWEDSGLWRWLCGPSTAGWWRCWQSRGWIFLLSPSVVAVRVGAHIVQLHLGFRFLGVRLEYYTHDRNTFGFSGDKEVTWKKTASLCLHSGQGLSFDLGKVGSPVTSVTMLVISSTLKGELAK